MFEFQPLVPVPARDRTLLFQYAKHLLDTARDQAAEKAAIAAKSRVTYMDGKSRRFLTREPGQLTPNAMFSNVQTYQTLHYGEENRKLRNYPSRRVSAYQSEGNIDVFEQVRAIQDQKPGPVRVLDIGGSSADMLWSLQEQFPDVQTHLISPTGEPHHPVNHAYGVIGEHLPRRFRRRFDVIVSSFQMLYSIFTHHGLRNITEALAPGGIASVNWHVNGPFNGENDFLRDICARFKKTGFDTRLTRHFSTDPNARLTPEGLALLQKGKRYDKKDADRMQPLAMDPAAWARQPKGWRFFRATAWINEVARLRKDPALDVRILEWEKSPAGMAPARLRIWRKNNKSASGLNFL